MKRLLILLTALTSFAAGAQRRPYSERAAEYVRLHKDWAIAEQKRCGIPAAITLAQGLHETDAGESELATVANNHFGIKCKKEWTGETFNHDDDAPQECFRKYTSALESYKDHSDYLKTAKRYSSCFALDATDYTGWARELRKCGYATNPIYAQKLVKLIEDYHLQDYTVAAMRQAEAPQVYIASAASPVAAAIMAEEKHPGEVVPEHDTPAEARDYGKVVKKDGLKGFWAKGGDVLLEYAIQYKVRYAKLLEINSLPDAPLAADQFIYLEKGSAVERMMAKDMSTPTPVVVTAEAPAAVVVNKPVAATPTPAVVATPAPVASATDATADAEARLFGTAAQKPAPSATAPTPVATATSAPAAAPAEKPFNIADEKAVEEAKATEPQDEFSKMKSRFDKVVYAPAKPTGTAMPATNPAAPTLEKVLAAASASSFHVVKAGETAFSIAKANGITMQQLMDMNKMSFGTAIKVGQKLRVK